MAIFITIVRSSFLSFSFFSLSVFCFLPTSGNIPCAKISTVIKPPKPGLGFGILGFGILGFGLAWLGCGNNQQRENWSRRAPTVVADEVKLAIVFTYFFATPKPSQTKSQNPKSQNPKSQSWLGRLYYHNYYALKNRTEYVSWTHCFFACRRNSQVSPTAPGSGAARQKTET